VDASKFRTEAEERRFWETHDSSAFDWNKAERVRLPNLKPSSPFVSHRLPANFKDH